MNFEMGEIEHEKCKNGANFEVTIARRLLYYITLSASCDDLLQFFLVGGDLTCFYITARLGSIFLESITRGMKLPYKQLLVNLTASPLQ